MAGALVQSTTFPWAVSGESKICSKQSGNTVKMMYSSVQTPRMRVRTFSGLQGINMVKRSHDSHSTVAAATSFNHYPQDPIFTERADNALKFAGAEARRLGYYFVGPELILLGLLCDDTYLSYEGVVDKTAKDVLSSMGIGLDIARAAVVELLGSGGECVCVEIAFTPAARCALQLAKAESVRHGHSYIEPEHLLLGLLCVGGGVDIVLKKLGASLSDIRSQVMRLLVKDESEKDDSDRSFDNNILIQPFYRASGINLTELVVEKTLHPILGRQPLIKRVIRILGRLTKNNPCLVGEHGVGKTAIAKGLAQSTAGCDLPEFLQKKKVITLDMCLLVQEGFVKKLIDEIKQSGDIILFIDDFHTLFGARAVEGVIGVANILKQALLKGELQCIGATTPDEYQKHIQTDPILKRVLQPVKVFEPTIDETVDILMGLREKYENHHKVHYTHEALVAAAQLSYECITDCFLPGKAIDLIDEAGSFVRGKQDLVGVTYPELLQELKRVTELRLKTKEDRVAFLDNDLEEAAVLMEQEIDHKIYILEIEERMKEMKSAKLVGPTVTKADIKAIVES